ncbi:MAG: RNA-guided endonuclease InsQ/TnpB family protein [Promethearchaeota archaeon]|jgi:putative transposase
MKKRKRLQIQLNANHLVRDTETKPFWNNKKETISKKLSLPDENETNIKKINFHSWANVIQEDYIYNVNPPHIQLCNMETKDTENEKIINEIKSLGKELTTEERQKLLDKEKEKYTEKINKCNDSKKRKELKMNLQTRLHKIASQKNSTFKMAKIKSLEKKKNKIMKVKKLKIYLNNDQKAIFAKWFGTCRYMYNKVVSRVHENPKLSVNFMKLRNEYIPKSKISADEQWLLDVPKEVRANALSDFCKARSGNIKAVKENHIKSFDMHYKSRKNDNQCLVIPHRSIKINDGHINVYNGILKSNSTLKINRREKIPEILFDCRLKLIRPNYYHLYIPYTTSKNEKGAENQVPKIISLDPGVRTFLTGYTLDGRVLHFGKGNFKRIESLCLYLDSIRSLIAAKTTRCKKRLRLITKARKLSYRVRNLKTDLHKQVCKYLCENYDIILIPKFEVSKMVKKQDRNLKTKSARALLNLNHYEFRQRLLMKSVGSNECKVLICNEAYTSKTCTKCGTLKPALGGNKTFKCTKCKLVLDRDINGSRNIMLRGLVATCLAS